MNLMKTIEVMKHCEVIDDIVKLRFNPGRMVTIRNNVLNEEGPTFECDHQSKCKRPLKECPEYIDLIVNKPF